MARKKKHPEHVNHERWLISYADFITLLFAFFVVMFAVSQVDSQRVGRFTQAFSVAIGADVFPLAGNGMMEAIGDQVMDGDAPPAHHAPDTTGQQLPEELRRIQRDLQTASSQDSLRGLQVLRRRNELVLRLPENIFFEVGSATVRDPALRVIAAIADAVRDRPVEVRVEGHTDNKPIRSGRYASNWELSTARAVAVLQRLAADGTIAAPRLSAAGFGEFRPVATNDDDNGRQQNRRVDFVLSVMDPTAAEESDGGAATEETTDAAAATTETPQESADADVDHGRAEARATQQQAEESTDR